MINGFKNYRKIDFHKRYNSLKRISIKKIPAAPKVVQISLVQYLSQMEQRLSTSQAAQEQRLSTSQAAQEQRLFSSQNALEQRLELKISEYLKANTNNILVKMTFILSALVPGVFFVVSNLPPNLMKFF